MNADQAFDNLQGQNAFSIPKAGPGVAPHNVDGEPEYTGGDAGALRVDELFDSRPEYSPPSGESRRGVYANPTETDLDPVDEPELDTAQRQGARIVGRDTQVIGDDDLEPTPARVLSDDEAASDAPGDGDPLLSGARRVRRFAYLPVAGIDAFETSVRELAARLRAAEPEAPSLMITSAGRGEGRTEIAVRMALALARKVGTRVLLADFDIRRPKAGPRLGISTKFFTLRDVLSGACDLSEALVVSEEDNLYVLPSRVSDRDGDEVLDDDQVGWLLGELHNSFDFVILDCGPVSQADVLMLGRHVGHAALAGMCGLTTAPAMNAAAAKLAGAGTRVAGMVLAGA